MRDLVNASYQLPFKLYQKTSTNFIILPVELTLYLFKSVNKIPVQNILLIASQTNYLNQKYQAILKVERLI